MSNAEFVNSIIDSLSDEFKHLLGSIADKDEDNFLGALNVLLAKTYSLLPNGLQFSLRTAIPLLLSRYQARIPSLLFIPLLAFVRAYISSLEEQVGAPGAPRSSPEDVRTAAEKVAVLARDGASDLGKLFAALRTAVANTPPPTHPEGDMPKQTQSSPPAAPAQGKKGGLLGAAEGLSALAAALPALSEGLKTVRSWLAEAGEGAEEAVTWMAYLLMAVAVALVVTGIAILGIAVAAPSASGHVAWIVTALWLALPLGAGVAGAIVAPDGSPKLGSVVASILLVGGLSSLVVATAHGVALFAAPFAWSHLAVNLAAIVVADFTWRLGDMGSDALKALIRIIPDSLEADWMRTGAIGFRKALFTLAVADTGIAFLVALWATWNHTLYGVGSLGLAIACLLMAAYGYSRTSLTPNEAPGDLRHQVGWHRQKSLSRFFSAGSTLGILLGVLPLGVNALLPPTCPDGAEIAPHECGSDLPSYAKRWNETQRSAVEAVKAWVEALTTPAKSPPATVVDPCDTSRRFVDRLEKGACEVVLQAETADPQLKGLCQQAQSCGLLDKRGRKR